ncbi:43339_t:CDS:2, partial [Gigaspora margarita]
APMGNHVIPIDCKIATRLPIAVVALFNDINHAANDPTIILLVPNPNICKDKGSDTNGASANVGANKLSIIEFFNFSRKFKK